MKGRRTTLSVIRTAGQVEEQGGHGLVDEAERKQCAVQKTVGAEHAAHRIDLDDVAHQKRDCESDDKGVPPGRRASPDEVRRRVAEHKVEDRNLESQLHRAQESGPIGGVGDNVDEIVERRLIDHGVVHHRQKAVGEETRKRDQDEEDADGPEHGCARHIPGHALSCHSCAPLTSAHAAASKPTSRREPTTGCRAVGLLRVFIVRT